MKKGIASLAIAIVFLVLSLFLITAGILDGLNVMDVPYVSNVLSLLSPYVSIYPGEYGIVSFGVLLLLISIVVFAFRKRKPFSMFLPFFLVGIYITVAMFARLAYGTFVPEFLFATLKNDVERNSILFFILIVVEIALTSVLLIATSRLDSRWRKKKELIRKKLENEGVLVSEEDVLAQKEKARVDKNALLDEKKAKKEAAKLEKTREKAERKELRKEAKKREKEDKEYEKTREIEERKKEFVEQKEDRKARKEADRKAYLEALENDKKDALSRKEEKKNLKEKKKLEKEKKREDDAIESSYEIPQGPPNPNNPIEFPDLPDIDGFPNFDGEKSKEKADAVAPHDDFNNYAKREEPVRNVLEERKTAELDRPKFDLKRKRFNSGGMLEATLEMMNGTKLEDKRSDSAPKKVLDDKSVDNMPSSGSIAPSNLPPSHPRYKMFESLQQAPVIDENDIKENRKEEKEKIAPSTLSPEHPRYKMFEALKSDSGLNSVSHYPSRAFEPEIESTPTTGVKSIEKEEYNAYKEKPLSTNNEPRIFGEKTKTATSFSQETPAPISQMAKQSMPVEDIKPTISFNMPKPKVDDEPNYNDKAANDDIPEQTESLDLSVGIGGLVSNNAGYSAIMKRERRLYTAPPVSLLKDYPGISSEIDEYTQMMGDAIVQAYAEQRIVVQLSNIIKGPTVTMYELTLDSGTSINRVTSRENDLNYALGGKNVRILAPVPGKKAVGIEVPNAKKSMVGFKDMIYALRANAKYMDLKVPMILGKTITGEPIVIDVAKMPHMIIAGTTGSGKSVCINAFINTLIYQKGPADVRLILVDPKVVELSLYNGIPHLLTPVITDAKKVVKMLNFLVEEMERRYSMLSNVGVRNIEGYNQKLKDEHIAAERMPYIVLIMDEFADMMTVVGKDIENQISRLAAKARAAGIHLILATQRPSSDVITGTIKSNLPARIAFAVSSSINSRVILDEGGAENLLGKGDMLLLNPSQMGLTRIQGAFLSDSEVDSIVSFAKENGGEPDYLDDAIFEEPDDKRSDDEFSDGPIGDENSDEVLLETAKQIVYEKKSASASYLQRRMKIGYNRAARLIEMMEERGIVGPANGSKPREILKFE